MEKDLSVIFKEEPKQWGLRGDPYFWAELREAFVGEKFPYTYDEDIIVEMVCRKFESVSGVPLTYDARPYVEKYAHGGCLPGIFPVCSGSGGGWLRYLKIIKKPVMIERIQSNMKA